MTDEAKKVAADIVKGFCIAWDNASPDDPEIPLGLWIEEAILAGHAAARADAECAVLREALEFYARVGVPHGATPVGDTPIHKDPYWQDQGKRARAALSAPNPRAEALLRVVEAARGVGMNWKLGVPYGLDALDDALAALDGKVEVK